MRNKSFITLSLALFLCSLGNSKAIVLQEQLPTHSTENVYLHFLMYGQSLSVGAQSYPVLSTENIEGNYMLGDHIWINYWNNSKGTLNPLVGKLAKQEASGATNKYPFTRSGSITAECPLYGVVNHLQKKTGGNFIATSCGTSGRSIEELSKESTVANRKHYTAEFKATLTYGAKVAKDAKYEINCPVIFFMQGENNYENKGSGLVTGTKSTSDKDEYKQLLIRLKENMQDDIVEMYGQAKKPVFITYQAGCQYGKIKELPIGMAQLEASNEHNDIICAGPVYPMPDRGGHLDPNGYRWFGEMLAKVYYKTQVLGEQFKPLQPKKIERNENGVIRIKYHIPAPPLVLDTWTVSTKFKDYGFEVHKEGIKQTIRKVEIDGDCIVLTCGSDISNGNVEVIYAGVGENGVLNRGHGNLRDSDDYPSYFKYIDLDKKEGGVYVYPRDAGNSLRPVTEVKNSNGQAIYDQPYPLHNWSVAYYYKLNDGQEEYIVPGFEHDTAVASPKQDDKFGLYQSGTDLFIINGNPEDMIVDLFDIAGRFISRSVMKSDQKSLSLGNLFPGIYIVKAFVGKSTKQIKLFI